MNDLSNEDLRIFTGVLVQAAAGKKIQTRHRYTGFDWEDKKDFDKWFPKTHEYRIKPEPRELWVNLQHSKSAAYNSKDLAFECIHPDVKYTGIAIHFKEVIDE